MANKTAVVMDDVFLMHDTGPGHPETPARLATIYSVMEKEGLVSQVMKLPRREATAEEIARVHSKGHFERVKGTAGEARNWMDGDTPTSPDSYKSAVLAAGGLIAAAEAVINGDADNAFALVRPPGHHAEREQAMGFCLFNNVAVAAMHAVEALGLKRVLVIDWDVHHGNGTQHSFYHDPRALYFSTHRYPFYPGTGYYNEIGEGEGKGYTVNVPLPAGCDDTVFDHAFTEVLLPVARGFKPEAILVSAGFDTHRSDPLGGMRMTEDGFGRLAARVNAMASELCQGKVIYTLEGGYDLAGLAGGVKAVLEVCLGKRPLEVADLAPPDGFHKLVEMEKDCLGAFWPGIGGKS